MLIRAKHAPAVLSKHATTLGVSCRYVIPSCYPQRPDLLIPLQGKHTASHLHSSISLSKFPLRFLLVLKVLQDRT